MEEEPSTVATGVEGLDFVLQGGIPARRPTLVRGGPGTGKTVLATTFLTSVLQSGHAAVLATCDESPDSLTLHARSLGLDLDSGLADGRLRIVDLRPDHSEDHSGGELDLSVILARLEHALQVTGAQHMMVDAVDALQALDFGGVSAVSLRSQLVRVFDWIRERGVTTILTAGCGNSQSNRSEGMDVYIEDYIADCVIHLEQALSNRRMTRLLRVVKRRGHPHGSNAFPYLIDEQGFYAAPVTRWRLGREPSSEHLSTGISGLDAMLGGSGPYLGSALMFSGPSGTGKTTFAAAFAGAACAAGRRVLVLSFEEGAAELLRNQRSVGLDLEPYTQGERPLLQMQPVMASELGQEEHLLRVVRTVEAHGPDVVILDPVNALLRNTAMDDGPEMLLRLFSLLKEKGVTTVATELLTDDHEGSSRLNVSSMLDVWVKLRRDEVANRLYRRITLAKARGLPTSDRVCEFQLSADGVTIDNSGGVQTKMGGD